MREEGGMTAMTLLPLFDNVDRNEKSANGHGATERFRSPVSCQSAARRVATGRNREDGRS
jgi:hypothetical protein